MSIPLNILKILKCCLSENAHIVREANLLSCGGNACKSCIFQLKHDNTSLSITCSYCKQEHNKDNLTKKTQSNPQVEQLVETYASELILTLRDQYEDLVKYFKTYQLTIDNKLQKVAQKVDLKAELVQTLVEMTRGELVDQVYSLKTSISRVSPLKLIEQTRNFNYATNLQGFYAFQTDLIQLKNELNAYYSRVDDIQFVERQVPMQVKVNRDLLGHIRHTFVPNYSSSLKSLNHTSLPQTGNLVRMAFSHRQQILYAIDYETATIKLTTSSGSYLNSLTNEILGRPWAICVDEEEMFIGDQERHEIFVFSLRLILRRRFGKGVIKLPSALKIDTRCVTKRVLYVAEWACNVITIWNSKTGDLLHRIDIDSPSQIDIKNNRLYVVSTINGCILTVTRKLQWVTKGTNALFIIDLATLTIMLTLQLDSWIKLRGIQVDHDCNVLVTAYEINKQNQVSPNRFLFCFNENGQLLGKLRFTSDGIDCNDLMLVSSDKLISCYSNRLTIVNFKFKE